MGVPGDLWFSSKADDKDKAIGICKVCPVTDECLNYAMDNKEEYGIWGALTPQERQELWTAT